MSLTYFYDTVIIIWSIYWLKDTFIFFVTFLIHPYGITLDTCRFFSWVETFVLNGLSQVLLQNNLYMTSNVKISIIHKFKIFSVEDFFFSWRKILISKLSVNLYQFIDPNPSHTEWFQLKMTTVWLLLFTFLYIISIEHCF